MTKLLKVLTTGLVAIVLLMPALSRAQGQDIWLYQGPGDTFYFENFDTAAISQSDGTIAILSFPNGETSIKTHIGFYANDIASSLKSTLIDADGTAHSVIVDGENLAYGTPTEDGFITYHYTVNDSDAPKFQHASLWRIETSAQTVTFSLKGSRVALDQVLAIRAKPQQADDDDDGFNAYMVDDCDNLAGHPNDQNSRAAGVKWSDLDGEAAVSSCELAVLLNDDIPRLQYQLGRAYDKVGNPEAYTALTKAALEMRYPMAFNHLGLLLWDGDYVTQDLERARDLLELGAEMGSLSSQYSLGRFLIKEGDGSFDLSYGKAMFKSAADAGHVISQRTYGQHLVNGTFGSTEPREAAGYLARAADSGDIAAAYDLAQMYIGGQGINADPAQYLYYLKLAARGGHVKAKEELGYD